MTEEPLDEVFDAAEAAGRYEVILRAAFGWYLGERHLLNPYFLPPDWVRDVEREFSDLVS